LVVLAALAALLLTAVTAIDFTSDVDLTESRQR
jgi:hypothetical protein